MKEYFKSSNRPKSDDNSYEQLQAQLNQDSIELSYYSGVMNDYAFVKANPSIYTTDKKGNKKLIIADKTKTKSSKRSLPLEPIIESFLLDLKEKQEINKKLCGNSYNQE